MDNFSSYYENDIRRAGAFKFYQYTLYAVPGPNVPLHWHEEFEIVLQRSDGILSLDGEKISYRSDDILFINPRQLHSTYNTSEGWSYHFVIHPELLCENCISDNKNSEFHFPEIIDSSDTYCRQIVEDLLFIPTPISVRNRLFIMNKLFELLLHLSDKGYPIIEENADMSAQTEYVKSAIRYIQKNLTHKIPVQNIADDIGISKEYLMRLFKHYTGETINSYMQNHRMEAAIHDLDAGFSLADIIEKYDYNDVSYFYRLFKKKYGVTPGKYKKTT